MLQDYIAFGERIDGEPPANLTLPMAKAAWHAMAQRREFTPVEVRRFGPEWNYAEALIVDCANDAVPTRNSVGIRYRERLALVFRSDRDAAPEVRALRRDFPVTLHQNHVEASEPASLCLYFPPWIEVRRSWTAERHLSRILWWLAETANGTLHRPDQPLEQLYFHSPYELVLPHDFEEKVANPDYQLVAEGREWRPGNRLTLSGKMALRAAPAPGKLDLPCLAVSLTPVVHGPIERFPATLGGLEEQLQRRGISIAEPLYQAVRSLSRSGVFANSSAKHTFLIVSIPLLRDAGGEAERITPMGFVADANIGDLGVATGALDKIDGSYVAVPLLAGTAGTREDWRRVAITPLSVIDAFTPKLARQMCGIGDEGPAGILAGVGALGSKMLDLWTRSGWGRWTVLDPDHVKPHNLARHTALELHVGHRKSDVAVNLAALLYPGQPETTRALAVAATAADNAELGTALDAADIVIDVTTTLAFPRTLASRDTVRRAVSVFITPSGEDAVMLLEDAERAIRLDVLEVQYYREVIGAPWGATHLAGNQGHLWTGAGCRDVSAVIPNELIGFHGANLARMVRVLTAAPEARLLVWRSDPATGAVVANSYTPATPHTGMLDGLAVIWDAATEAKLRAKREARLPNETGGVLLGYFDLVLRKVFIVDAFSAPADSQEAPTGFVRGVAGLEEALKEAGRRTGHVVGYVGEWHSHPRNHSAAPSRDDVMLLAHLAGGWEAEGLPALMLIVGEGEMRWLAGTAL
jgi:hypothetical protein